MAKLPLCLRFLSFILVLFFLPLDVITNNNAEVIIKKFIYILILFFSLTRLCDVFFSTLAKRKDDVQAYNPFTFYFLLFISLFLTILAITLLNSYIDKVQFYIILLMIVIRIIEIKLSYTNYHISHVIFALLFDTLLGCLSFEFITPMSIIHTILIGSSLACINGALIVAYKIWNSTNQNNADEDLKGEKKISKKKKKQKTLLNQVSNPELKKEQLYKQRKKLIKCYQFLSILGPIILGLCVNLKFISYYYYLTFLIIFPATYIYTNISKSLSEENFDSKHIYGQTAFISLAFIILILVARILTYNFPAF